MSNKIALLVDSGMDLPTEIIAKEGVYVIPLNIIYKDQVYIDKVTITSKEIYDRLELKCLPLPYQMAKRFMIF